MSPPAPLRIKDTHVFDRHAPFSRVCRLNETDTGVLSFEMPFVRSCGRKNPHFCSSGTAAGPLPHQHIQSSFRIPSKARAKRLYMNKIPKSNHVMIVCELKFYILYQFLVTTEHRDTDWLFNTEDIYLCVGSD